LEVFVDVVVFSGLLLMNSQTLVELFNIDSLDLGLGGVFFEDLEFLEQRQPTYDD
jgi:hypothetical protein